MARVLVLHISDERAAFAGMPEKRKNQLELDEEERGLMLGKWFERQLEMTRVAAR